MKGYSVSISSGLLVFYKAGQGLADGTVDG